MVVFFWWRGVVLEWSFSGCGGVFGVTGGVVVFLFWCGGVLVVVFVWWCCCFGVVVFLWWRFCACVFVVVVVVFLWWCFYVFVVVFFVCFFLSRVDFRRITEKLCKEC